MGKILGVHAPKVAYLKDIRASGVASDNLTTAPGWNTRTLNTVEGDSEIVGLASNVITLQPGEYDFLGRVPWRLNGAQNSNMQCRLFDIDAADTAIMGDRGGKTGAGDVDSTGYMQFIGRLTLLVETDFRVEHYISAAVGATEGGEPVSSGEDEVYTQLMITKWR